MNKDYLQWIRHEFYLWKDEIKYNAELASLDTVLSHLKWLRNYYETHDVSLDQ